MAISGHGCGCCDAVTMLLTRRKPNHVTGRNLLDRARARYVQAPTIHPEPKMAIRMLHSLHSVAYAITAGEDSLIGKRVTIANHLIQLCLREIENVSLTKNESRLLVNHLM